MDKALEGLILGFIIGVSSSILFAAIFLKGPNDIQQEAIDAGAAEWTIDRQTGVRSFEWKTDKGN